MFAIPELQTMLYITDENAGETADGIFKIQEDLTDGSLSQRKTPQNLYSDDSHLDDPHLVEDSGHQKEIRRVYRLDQMEPESTEEDDENEDLKVRSTVLQTSLQERTRKQENMTYQPQQTANSGATKKIEAALPAMSPEMSRSTSPYVCMPGSKGACGTCPIYSMMTKANSFARGNDTFVGQPYLANRNFSTQFTGRGL